MLNQLKPDKSQGPDSFHLLLLRTAAEEISIPLCYGVYFCVFISLAAMYYYQTHLPSSNSRWSIFTVCTEMYPIILYFVRVCVIIRILALPTRSIVDLTLGVVVDFSQ